MKRLYLLCWCLLPISLAAQKKVDLDRFYFNVQVRSLPKVRLDTTYRTYLVSVGATRLMQSYFQDMNPEKSVLLEGWKKLAANAHISISVKLGDLLPESFSVKERQENVTDVFGRITGTRTVYHEEVIYTFEATAGITDHKGMHIMDIPLADRGYKQVHSGPEFPLRKLAEGYFLVNSVTLSRELYQSCVNRAIRYLSGQLTRNFGFGEESIRDYMYIAGSRKHPEYEASRKAMQQVSDALFSLTASQPVTGLRELLQPAIDYFEGLKTAYSTTSKHDRKMRYAGYFNLAVLYYYLDDPQAMMKEASGLVLNDYETGDGKGFEATARALKQSFDRTGIFTRHFPLNPDAYTGPGSPLAAAGN